MTVLTASVGKLGARANTRAAGFRVEVMSDWQAAIARWQSAIVP